MELSASPPESHLSLSSLPLEIIYEIFQDFDSFNIYTKVRPICRRFHQIFPPLLYDLTPEIWTEIFSSLHYFQLLRLKETCQAFRKLIKNTKNSDVKAKCFRETEIPSTSFVLQRESLFIHPAFLSPRTVWYLHYTGSRNVDIAYGPDYNMLMNKTLLFPQENWTSPPVKKAIFVIRVSGDEEDKTKEIEISQDEGFITVYKFIEVLMAEFKSCRSEFLEWLFLTTCEKRDLETEEEKSDFKEVIERLNFFFSMMSLSDIRDSKLPVFHFKVLWM